MKSSPRNITRGICICLLGVWMGNSFFGTGILPIIGGVILIADGFQALAWQEDNRLRLDIQEEGI